MSKDRATLPRLTNFAFSVISKTDPSAEGWVTPQHFFGLPVWGLTRQPPFLFKVVHNQSPGQQKTSKATAKIEEKRNMGMSSTKITALA